MNIIHNGQWTWKQPKCPLIDEWINKMLHTHTHTMEYYSSTKKKEILPFVTTWIHLMGIMLREIVRQRKTNTVSYYLHVESKKIKQMNVHNKTETNSQI